MPKVNLFDHSQRYYNEIVSMQNTKVYVNGDLRNAVITNTDMASLTEKYIVSDKPVSRGDLIYYNSRYYLVWQQSQATRYDTYKGMMRLCDYDVIFDLSQMDEKDQVPEKYLIKAPVLARDTSDATLAQISQVAMQEVKAEIHVWLRETPTTVLLRNLRGNKGRFLFGGYAWNILHVSRTEKGFLNLTCRIDNDRVTDKYTPEGTLDVSELEQFVDDSLYVGGSSGGGDPDPEPPVETLPPESLVTDISLLGYNDSTRTLTWTKPTATANYGGFAGYRLTVERELIFGGTSEIITNQMVYDTTDNPSYTFSTDPDVEYGMHIYIEAVWTDGTSTVITQQQYVTYGVEE